MSYLLAEPELLASVATEIDGIGSAISTAGTAAAGPTSSLLAAAGDEVSEAIANLFSVYGRECQAVLAQVEAFRNEFAQTLAAAGVAYAQTEAASLAALRGALGIPSAGPAVSSASTIPPFTANLTSLFLGPTGVPIPDESYVQAANNLFVRSSDILRPLYTPEELYPLTGVKSLTLNASVEEGLTILDNAIMAQLSIPGNTVTVFGYSQSAIIASLEMQKLAALGASAPTASQLNFVLVGNEMNPNGGMLARFPDLSLPSLGLTFYGATPSDTIYPTAIYTLEYDGFADFPRYPLNFIADLNAVMGIPFVHVKYLDLTAAQVDSAIELPTSPGYSGVTSYYVIPTENLPLLEPLRAIPVIGNPLANLIQPDLKVIVNLGYGDPNYGYSTSYADVRTPFGLFPDVSPGTIVDALAAGTQEGIQDFTADLQAMFGQPIPTPEIMLPTPADILGKLSELPSPAQVVNTLTAVVANDYAVLLPTADIGLAVVTTLPLYSTQLFFDQLLQGNLIDAFGYPIAATVGLLTIGGAVEFLTIAAAAQTTVQDIGSLIP
ncbi:PE family protein [Mycobacterium marinum]|uniref:PE family protein n=1 Tax=Mycobacterium marinum TaxID=1781 RepID=UPI000B95CC2D|nr:PE-PPE domain-containing protein [Mycobacterium marinum]MDC8982954.1 PE-PPE domain-containing protein [Mycobacterium marinum]MDC8994076.1 PE-PPE domain-containing protein [Mycobacterium marinum]MDC8999685.1 PE-PPE domain-containing protein [Mycobacterium marinum]MDC9010234.1 PE-PPE domain-containing protein [Mycobacterium marinum]MDC9015930.1 PE-PPE domain-containing protein [Mycobacterium marinum]